jgi:hypothetical protein
MTPAQRKKHGLRFEHECTPDEREAIARFYTISHFTNLPRDRAKALWDVRPNRRTGRLEAALFGGFII